MDPVVRGAGDTEPHRTQASPQGAQTESVTQCDQGHDGREAQRTQRPGLGSEQTSGRRRQMAWDPRDEEA